MFPKKGGVINIRLDKAQVFCFNARVIGLEIVLHVVISALAGCLTVAVLLRARGVRGVRALHRELLDLESDHAALVKRVKKIQSSAAGEASSEAKKTMSKATLDFVAEQRFQQPDLKTIGQ